MTDEREPDGFKIAAEQNIISARFNARTAPKKTPQEQELLKHHRIMMTAAHNGVLATFSAMHPAVQKAVVNWHDPDPKSGGWTALMVASSRGHVEIVKHFLSIGADVSLMNDTGYAAIHLAVKSGKREMVETLLDAGADANHRRTEGWTPLMDAVGVGKAEIVKALLERGAHTHIPTPHNQSIRARAGELGLTEIAVLIETAQKKRGGELAAKLVEKGTAETITVSKPLKLKNSVL